MTNYERIKQMSVEEMARLMDSNCLALTEKVCMEMSNNGTIICDENCVSCFKKWLESEVKE